VEDRRRQADELAMILTQIRALDKFASFGLPPTASELLAEGRSGPVVSFNVSRYRSDALLLTREGIASLELPGLEIQTVADHISTFHQNLNSATNPGKTPLERKAAQTKLCEILEWLWDTAAEPVLQALGYHGKPHADAAWPRVWWVTGGMLGLLPIHAAGYHTDSPTDQGRRAVMDRVVSSHIPTIRALTYARQNTPVPGPEGGALIVAMPTTPGISGCLPNVPAEVAMLLSHLPEAVVLIESDSRDVNPGIAASHTPTKANVLTHLPSCPIVHFACHGANDPTDPSNSLLLLHDYNSDPLTVASLAPIKLDRAQLAYLSACSTAFTGVAELVDETIHLTSAFQLAGFPHVIGTLWPITDALAVSVADSFYTGLCTSDGALDTNRAAHALHHAVRAARDRLPASPSLWASYLHVGP
jgi:hypothetical protein